jgi:TPR repeat protein
MKKALLGVCFFILVSIAAFAQVNTELLKKAELGDAEAQTGLGFLYYDGEGVPQDYKKAFEWLSKAAEQGNALAQYTLGVMYYEGFGVKKDYKKTFEFYKKAAVQGDADAQSLLGCMYIAGNGIPKDIVTGCAWIYLSKDSKTSAICDKHLNSNQLTSTLDIKNELAKQIVGKNSAK